MTSSASFSINNGAEKFINRDLSFGAKRRLGRYAKALLPAILLVGIAVYTQGCAATKCDCPKFGGHRLKH